jgi:hypothetical protein
MFVNHNGRGPQGKTYTKLNGGREEINALVGVERVLDKGGCDDALLATQAAQQVIGEVSAGVSHREGSASSTILRLHDFITAELNAMHKFLPRLAGDLLSPLSL